MKQETGKFVLKKNKKGKISHTLSLEGGKTSKNLKKLLNDEQKKKLEAGYDGKECQAQWDPDSGEVHFIDFGDGFTIGVGALKEARESARAAEERARQQREEEERQQQEKEARAKERAARVKERAKQLRGYFKEPERAAVKMSKDVLVPKDTGLNQALRVDNLYLQYYKLPNYGIPEKEKNATEKKFYVNDGFQFSVDNQFLKYLAARRRRLGETLGGENRQWEMEADWRFIHGMGEASVYEIGLTLHFVYGIPYFPGQTLKGLLRSHVLLKYFYTEEIWNGAKNDAERDELLEEAALENETYRLVFGSTEERGRVNFLDAFPVSAPRLTRDIMTPHYGKYLMGEGRVEPTDTENPIPIDFLSFEGGRYLFHLRGPGSLKGLKGRFSASEPETPVLDLVKKLLVEALAENGVGAKTSVGYGLFRPVS